MIKLYTIGFTSKSAPQFFELLESHQVDKLIDTRVSNNSQLSGFAKGRDLAFFAQRVAGIDYAHELDFAPTKDLLSQYRKKEISWETYAEEYLNLLDLRQIQKKIDITQLHQNCLLCSEHSPEKCHRRLLAEYLQAVQREVEIVHLK